MLTLYRRWPKLSIITGVGALIQARNIDFTSFNIKDIEVGIKSGSGTTRSVTFSRAHTTAPTVVVATFRGNVTTGVVTITVDQFSATGFRMTPRYLLDNGEHGSATEAAYWVAVWT